MAKIFYNCVDKDVLYNAEFDVGGGIQGLYCICSDVEWGGNKE